ncbi:uncharacterized protein ACN427_001671 isoform 3-T4 [Glossina fuscipes fuscipes]
MANNKDLYEIWCKACNHYDIPEDTIRSWYDRIRLKLSESGTNRVYHNWSDMLMHKRVELQFCKPHIVLAAFFQYYEFDLEKACVEKNCQVFREFCQDAMLEDEQIKFSICWLLGEKVTSPMLTTVEEDAAILQDLDLIILAAPADVYKRYAELSRQEWTVLSECNYNILRRKTLNALLALDIYKTEEFSAKYAKAARDNIERELTELNNRSC